ncbi:MAG TPA: hypothetical protein VFK01_11990 [Bradyrhizobium sp.]|jgi:hypothetical protein|nr:hypothetical protein [Bradyrhizobium sp.]
MRVFVCLGFLLAAHAANAQTYTTTVERSSNTVTTTGSGRTSTSQTTSHSTYTTVVSRPRRYQPTGASGYNPMGY